MVVKILSREINRLREGTGGFRHYIFSREAATGRALEDHLADFARPMGETECVIYYGMAFFGLGGFTNVENFAVRTFH